MRDSEILQAKMVVRLLSGQKFEIDAWPSKKAVDSSGAPNQLERPRVGSEGHGLQP
jgi:hypothetical protein